ncbi:MAG: amidohydrolase family protein [Beijerinckiaceae bacterium]
MKLPSPGAIDCDMHINVPGVRTLMPYMSDYWQDQIATRYIDRSSFAHMNYPPRSPLSCREDWRPVDGPLKGVAGGGLADVQANLLDAFGLKLAVANVFHGSNSLFNEDMGAEFAKAINEWVVREWLDREPRLRATVTVHAQNPALAVQEIERRAGDPRFVAVQLPLMGDAPLGRRIYWPIFEAAQRYGLSLAVHAGSTYRHPLSGAGFGSYQIEDYIHMSTSFENLIVSFLAEGVFEKFPDMKLVCMESGFTFIPTLMWRANKTWRGVRAEVPWIGEPPAEIIRRHVRFTLQPVDAPRDAKILGRILEQIDCEDMLLFSTDYPHWQFDGEDVLPDGLPAELVQKILTDNPLKAFPRLATAAAQAEPARSIA